MLFSSDPNIKKRNASHCPNYTCKNENFVLLNKGSKDPVGAMRRKPRIWEELCTASGPHSLCIWMGTGV
jgi:hypothetical protein